MCMVKVVVVVVACCVRCAFLGVVCVCVCVGGKLPYTHGDGGVYCIHVV